MLKHSGSAVSSTSYTLRRKNVFMKVTSLIMQYLRDVITLPTNMNHTHGFKAHLSEESLSNRDLMQLRSRHPRPLTFEIYFPAQKGTKGTNSECRFSVSVEAQK